MAILFEKVLIKIFTIFWKKRLLNDKVIKVKRWNTAIIDNKAGQRQTVTFLDLVITAADLSASEPPTD